MLTLKRASKSRPSGEWSLDDYDVVERGQHGEKLVGRHPAKPTGATGATVVLDYHRARATGPAGSRLRGDALCAKN
jgi:hypothetical protein